MTDTHREPSEAVARLHAAVETGGTSFCTKCGWIGTPERRFPAGYPCGREGCGYMVSAPSIRVTMADARSMLAALEAKPAADEIMAALLKCRDECEADDGTRNTSGVCDACAVKAAGYYPDCPMRFRDEAKSAAEVTDEAVLHEDGCGRVSMTVEKWNSIEARLSEKREVTDEAVREALETARTVDCATHHQADLLNAALAAIEAALTRTGAENKKFRIMFNAMDKDARRPSVVLVEKVFDLQAENERLRAGSMPIKNAYLQQIITDYADGKIGELNDPAFVRVPREVLKSIVRKEDYDELVCEYGGDE